MKYICVFVLFMFISCTPTSEVKTNALIDDKDVTVCEGEMPLSSVVELKRIVPLETGDSCLVSSVEKIIKRGDSFYIKSRNAPLLVFGEDGKFRRQIGKIGVGPAEYVMLTDFDVDDENVYILGLKKIYVYQKNGTFICSIPVERTATWNIHVLKDQILQVVGEDKHAIHITDMDGKEQNSMLDMCEALRATPAIAFYRLDGMALFPLGNSNEILAYDEQSNEVSRITYFPPGQDYLTLEEENEYLKESGNAKGLSENKTCFKGLSITDTQLIFGTFRNNKAVIWCKDLRSGEAKAHLISSLKNDLIFESVYSFFLSNTDGDKTFLTYSMPYSLSEGLSKNSSSADSESYKRMKQTIDTLNVDEANPVIIEYVFK